MNGFGKIGRNGRLGAKIDIFGPKWAIFDSFDAEMAKAGFLIWYI